MDNPARGIWIVSGCVMVFVVTTCVLVGVFVAFFHDPAAVADITGVEPTQPTAVDISPRQISATVIRTSGAAPVTVGSSCTFPLTTAPNPSGGVWCNAQVVCSGRLLYGGETAGFFPCDLGDSVTRSVTGRDTQTTAQDGDASFSIDSASKNIELSDDARGSFGAYGLSARIDAIQ